MEELVDDKLVLDWIISFLHSKGLFYTADSLLIESDNTVSKSLPEPALSIQLSLLNGEWDKLTTLLKPFMELYSDDCKKVFLCLVYRQRICEMCFHNTLESASVVLKDILEEITECYTVEEFDKMAEEICLYYTIMVKKYPKHYAFQQATRGKTFEEIFKVIDSIFSENGLQLVPIQHRLVNMLTKGVLYDCCSEYCHQRATGNRINEIKAKLMIDNLKNFEEGLTSADSVSTHLYSWLSAIREDNIFKNEFKDKAFLFQPHKLQSTDNTVTSPLNGKRSCEKLPDFSLLADTTSNVAKVNETYNKEAAKICKAVTAEHPAKIQTMPLSVDGSKSMAQAAIKSQSLSNNVEDSYVNFLNEQSNARDDYKKLMDHLQAKQKDAQVIRTFLQENTSSEMLVEPASSLTNQMQMRPNMAWSNNDIPTTYIPIERTEESAVIRSAAFHPQGNVLAVGSNSRTLKLCDASGFNKHSNQWGQTKPKVEWMKIICKKSQVHKGSIYSLAWNGQGDVLASCSNDKLIKIFTFDNSSSTLLGPQYELSYHNGMVRDLTFFKNYGSGSLLASGGASDFVIYTYACDVDTVVHQLTGHSDQVLSLHSWSNGMLASASQDRSVRLWDLRSSRCISVLGFGNSSDYHSIPASVCTDMLGHYMGVGRDDNMVSVYDLRGGKAVGDYTGHSDEVRGISFNPTNNHLLMSSSYDGTALVTDTNVLFSGGDLPHYSRRCSFHTDKVIQCKWHPAGSCFATTSADRSCVLWTAVS